MPTMADDILETYQILINNCRSFPGARLEDVFPPHSHGGLERERDWLRAQLTPAPPLTGPPGPAGNPGTRCPPPGPTYHEQLVAFLHDLQRRLEAAEARWVTPECVDDAEEMWNDYPDFIIATLARLRALRP
jgi:hypothetical protein